MVKLTDVRINERAEELVLEVLRSGRLAQGPMVEEFEASMAKIAGTKHALAVSNGTVSLISALQALKLEPGDEVVIPGFTFVATLNAVLQVGATARVVDIDLDSFALSIDGLAEQIGPRTKAIMPVHLYGLCADMNPIATLAQEHNLSIVEDAAQAHGATYDGRPAGSWGIGSFSFYATKNVTTGEGGVVTTNDDGVAEFVRVFRNQGMKAQYQYEMSGTNLRMTDLQAAIGLSQLPLLSEWSEQRRANARTLSEGLAGIEGLVVPPEFEGRDHVYHQYTIRVTPEARLSRDDVVDQLRAKDIQCGVYYPRAVHDYDCFRAHPQVIASDLPNTQSAASQVISLPVNQWLTPAELDEVIAGVRGLLA